MLLLLPRAAAAAAGGRRPRRRAPLVLLRTRAPLLLLVLLLLLLPLVLLVLLLPVLLPLLPRTRPKHSRWRASRRRRARRRWSPAAPPSAPPSARAGRGGAAASRLPPRRWRRRAAGRQLLHWGRPGAGPPGPGFFVWRFGLSSLLGACRSFSRQSGLGSFLCAHACARGSASDVNATGDNARAFHAERAARSSGEQEKRASGGGGSALDPRYTAATDLPWSPPRARRTPAGPTSCLWIRCVDDDWAGFAWQSIGRAIEGREPLICQWRGRGPVRREEGDAPSWLFRPRFPAPPGPPFPHHNLLRVGTRTA